MSIAARFTREEYLALPESPPGVRFELLDGELVTMNDPLLDHQDAVLVVAAALRSWCRAAPDRGRATLSIDTVVGSDTFFGPDVQWFAGDRALPSSNARPWPVGDLVVEIASPSTRRYDTEIKLPRYLEAGAREVWLVETEPLGARVVRASSTTNRAGDVSSAGDGARVSEVLGPEDALSSPLLPGFSLPLTDLRG